MEDDATIAQLGHGQTSQGQANWTKLTIYPGMQQ